jgi:hypothetical protein
VKKEFINDVTPIESEVFINHGYITRIFVRWISQTRLRHMILELHHRDKTRMS